MRERGSDDSQEGDETGILNNTKIKGGEQMNPSPIALSRELKKKLGGVEMAIILRDGSIFSVPHAWMRNREIKLCIWKMFAKK